MAITREGEQLSRVHREMQVSLRGQTFQDILRLWPAFDPTDIESYKRFTDAAVPVIQARNGESSGLARSYYRRFRTMEGIPGSAPNAAPDELTPEEIIRSLRATGLSGTLRAIRAGRPPAEALRNGSVQATGSAGRLALNGGRSLITNSIAADPRARGWQRVTAFDPCAFCAMIASRGPVFKENTARFESHDHCMCTAEPVYDGSQILSRNDQFSNMWTESTRGLRGKEALNAFRQAHFTR